MSDRDRPDVATIRSRYDAYAPIYDHRFRSRRKTHRFRVIDRPQLALTEGAARVLEIGCGTGRLLGQVSSSAIGVDLSLSSLQVARSRGLVVAAADAHQLPFADGCFDAVIAGNATFRYLDYPRAFRECARVLRPDGWLGLHQYARRTFSPRDWIRRPQPPIEIHVGELAELEQPALDAGLALRESYLFRSIRFFPYALRIPRWLPGHLWGHCTLLFQKTSSAS